MKKIILTLIAVLCIFPYTVLAEDTKYKTLNLDEALKEEEIDHDFSNYTENDDQAIIYLFRGRGCAYCRKFLTFLNSIVDDYGKYFKVVSYEVWNDTNNASLMNDVASLMGKEASGVPYIIIGNQVFAGYSEEYDSGIKKAIKDQYESKNKYDVIKEVSKKQKSEEKKKDSSSDVVPIILAIITVGVVVIGVVVVLITKHKNDMIAMMEQYENKASTK